MSCICRVYDPSTNVDGDMGWTWVSPSRRISVVLVGRLAINIVVYPHAQSASCRPVPAPLRSSLRGALGHLWRIYNLEAKKNVIL